MNYLRGIPDYVGFGLAFLGFLAVWRLDERVEELEKRPHPNLIFAPPRVRKVLIGPMETTASPGAFNTAIELLGPETQVAIGQTIHVQGEVLAGICEVSNDPEVSMLEAQVGNAVTTITFFTMDGREAVRLYGRWTENEQPGTRPHLVPIDDLRRRNLIPNGEPNGIDIALKYEGEDCCYAFDDETCRYVKGWRNPKYRLPDAEYRVRIKIRGLGLREPQEEWLLLRNLGAGRGFDLEKATAS